eukprot:scaffold1033_cov205-Alexandrium_tamarense.AAC.3
MDVTKGRRGESRLSLLGVSLLCASPTDELCPPGQKKENKMLPPLLSFRPPTFEQTDKWIEEDVLFAKLPLEP